MLLTRVTHSGAQNGFVDGGEGAEEGEAGAEAGAAAAASTLGYLQ